MTFYTNLVFPVKDHFPHCNNGKRSSRVRTLCVCYMWCKQHHSVCTTEDTTENSLHSHYTILILIVYTFYEAPSLSQNV